MTITLPPREDEARPTFPDTMQCWFQPQSHGTCRRCKASVIWRTTVRSGALVPFARTAGVLHSFRKFGAELRRQGDRVDVLDRAHRHRCQARPSRRAHSPIHLKSARSARSLFDKE